MKKLCVQCSHPTNRYDNLCPNCYYRKPDSDNPQSVMEDVIIKTYKYVCECGEADSRVLILMCHGTGLVQSGAPRSPRSRPRDTRALMVDDPSRWYGRCYNCQQRINFRPPGRPKKYSDEERIWARKNYSTIYRSNTLMKVVQSYGSDGKWPECSACMQPATRVLWIGEFGKAPIGNHYLRIRRQAITDPEIHMQFAPYCDHHEVYNIGQRNHIKRQLVQTQLLHSLAESSRALEEMSY